MMFMNYFESVRHHVNSLLRNEAKHSFPELLSSLRETFGLSRVFVARCAEIHPLKLFYLESGEFKRHPSFRLLKKLSDFYDVDEQLMERKCDEYLGSGVKRRIKRGVK